MGCRSSSPSKADTDKAAAAAEKQRKRDAANAAMNAPKLDPKDFMCTKLKDQTIVKEPGSIKGQQFIIEECDNCTIYLLDHSATVSIDECTNCRIFVGPCESSVFVRTSKHMKLIIAAQQLRTRECHDLDILLYVSAGQPVIESSSNIRLGCFDYNYFGLAEQFQSAGLDPWYSDWSNVHDFTAAAGSGEKHWEYLDASVRANDLIPTLSSITNGTLENIESFVTPRTYGNRALPPAGASTKLLLAISSSHTDEGYTLLDATLKPLLDTNDCIVVRSRRVDMNSSQAKDKANVIFSGKSKFQQTQLSNTKGSNRILGFELLLSSAAIVSQLRTSLQDKLNAGTTFLSEVDASKQPLELFFENQAVM